MRVHSEGILEVDIYNNMVFQVRSDMKYIIINFHIYIMLHIVKPINKTKKYMEIESSS